MYFNIKAIFRSFLTLGVTVLHHMLIAQGVETASTSDKVFAVHRVNHIQYFSEFVTYLKDFRDVSVSYSLRDIPENRKVVLSSLDADTEHLLLEVVRQVVDEERSFKITRQRDNYLIRVEPELAPQSTGGISGVVKDTENGETLVGASVMLEGTSFGTVTDIDGHFELDKVPAGDYVLIVSFVGFKAQKLGPIHVVADNKVMLDIPMEANTEQLGEVVVTGEIPVQYAPIVNSTEVSMISSIKADPGIVTGISNQQISQSLDRDAADVMQRVPGVNLMNNFVLVRGLSQRYTMTYINGMMAPSTEADQRAFSFNLLPSGLIDNITVKKNPAPELQGGFAGGVVNVSTKQSHTARRIQVSLSSQYRSGSSFSNAYSNSGASDLDWIGGGLEGRKYEDRMYDPNFSWDNVSSNPYALREITLAHPKPYDLVKDKYDFDKRLRINYYDSWKVGGIRLNNLTSLGYTDQSQFVTGFTNGNMIPSNTIELAQAQHLDWEAVDSLYRQNLRISALQTLGVKINDDHKISFTGFFNRSVDDRTNIRDKRVDPSTETWGVDREVNYEYSVQDLLTGQLSGEHKIGVHEINWRIGRNFSSMQSPDIQSHKFIGVDSTFSKGVYQVRGVGDRVLRRGSLFTEETGITYGLDYRVKLWDRFIVKSGGMAQMQKRDFESWYYYLDYEGERLYSTGEVNAPWFNLSQIISDDLVIDPDDVNGDGFTGGAYLGRDFSEGLFSIENDYFASYFGGELPFLNKKLQLNLGLRYEYYSRKLFDEVGRELITSGGYDRRTGSTIGDTLTQGPINEYWLPSVSINWNIRNDMRATISYGKTIDRPAYRESAPFGYYQFDGNRRMYGDASLQDATIHNYDLRWELYPTAGEFVAFGVFYKDMKNIIEPIDRTATNNQSGYRFIYFNNSPKATSMGLEVEIRKNLGFIPLKSLQYFSLIANYALVHNEVDAIDLSGVEEPSNVPADGKSRPFVGGAPHVFNASLYFEQPDWGSTFSILINSIGQRMVAAGGPRVSPIYEQGRTTLDLVLQQRITSFLTLKAGIQNLTNTKILRYRDQNMDGKYDPAKIQEVNYYGLETRYSYDYLTRKYRVGSYYSLGLSMEF